MICRRERADTQTFNFHIHRAIYGIYEKARAITVRS